MACPSESLAPPVRPAAAGLSRSRLTPQGLAHRHAFPAVAGVLVLFLAASAAPSPLYVVYQQQWAFSATTLTGVFAIYVAGLLGSLLVFGALSDHVGRRPVLAAAIGLEAVALVLFLTAEGVWTLAAARLLQGVATGAAMTTLSAALIDLAPRHAPGRAGVVNSVAPVAGLAAGAVACGALVQFGPAPTHLVYALLLAGMAGAALVVLTTPESSTRRPGLRASLRPRVAMPTHLRADFAQIAPMMIASWALGGMYLSLGPSVAAGSLGLTNHLVGGLVVAALCGPGALTAYLLRGRRPEVLLVVADTLLAAGMVVTLAGIETSRPLLAAAGTLVAGVGFGAAALGGFGTLSRLAAPTERGSVFAFALVVCYLAFSLPALAAGLAATSFGLRPTTLVYGGGVVLLCLGALLAGRRGARRPGRGTTHAPEAGASGQAA